MNESLAQLLRYVARHRRYAGLTIFFGVLGFALSFAYPWIIGSVVDLTAGPHGLATAGERRSRLVWLTELATLTAFLHAAVLYGRGHFNVHLGNGVVTDVRRDLFEHLQKLSLGFFSRERTGALVSHLVHDVEEAASLIYTGIIVAGLDALQLAIAIVLLVAISWRLTLACSILLPAYAIVFAALNPRVRLASERMQTQLGHVSGNVAEQLSGQALVKTCTAERREAQRFQADVAFHHRLVVEQSHEGHVVASAGEVLVHLGTTVVIGYGGWLTLSGQLTPGTLTRFLGYTLVMYGPVRRFAELNITYQSSLSAMRRVFSLIARAPTIVESPRPHRSPPPRGAVRFESVRFRYDGDELLAQPAHLAAGSDPGVAPRWILDGVTFDVASGERVAIVGPSGTGKSTLVSLLPRLYDTTEGRVSVDGIDVRSYGLETLRASIGIVQQDSFMFTGSIRQNIAYGRPDAPEGELVAAARAAHADEFIRGLPGGYAARVGERGVNLSGGQRQRISIARALLKDPRILILDEATSALDTESERLVQRALETVMERRTCFIIAHRMSTIRHVDRVFVLEGGRVTEDVSRFRSRQA